MLLRVALVVAVATSLVLAAELPAAACSSGWTQQERRDLTVVFAVGRIMAVDLEPQADQPSKASGTWYRKVITLRADLVLKGSVGSTIRFVDSGIAQKDVIGGRPFFSWGGGGDCSTITEDPVGRYGAFALGRAPDGTLAANILFGAAFGTDASDPAIQALVASHGLALPSTATR